MKPGFALILSRQGIGLLQRSGGGWLAVDEVSLDDPDLSAKLIALRVAAEALAREAGEPKVYSKLILPGTEILYEDILLSEDPQADEEVEIEKHLDGRTPYALADLTYDYVVSDRLAQVAVVARETLAEAEEFATDNGFNPVCFSALPPAGTFTGEPVFGLAKAAKHLLPEGVTVERDDGEFEVLGAAELPDIAAADVPSPPSSLTTASAEPEPEFRTRRSEHGKADATAVGAQPTALPPHLVLGAAEGDFRSSSPTVQALRGALADLRNLLSLRPVPAAALAGLAACAALGLVFLAPFGPDEGENDVARGTTAEITLLAPWTPGLTIDAPTAHRTSDAAPPIAKPDDPPATDPQVQRLAALSSAPPEQPAGLGPPIPGAPSILSYPVSAEVFSRPTLPAGPDAPRAALGGASLARMASISPERPNVLGQPPVPTLSTASLVAEPIPTDPLTESTGDPAQVLGAEPAQPVGSVVPDAVPLVAEPARDSIARTKEPLPEVAGNRDTRPETKYPPVAPSQLLAEPAAPEVVLVSTLAAEELALLATHRPSARPEGLARPTAAELAETDPVLAQLRAIRPSARPKDLVPPTPKYVVVVNDGSQVSLSQRPKRRPAKIQQLAAQRIPQEPTKQQKTSSAASAAIVAPKKEPARRQETSAVARRATVRNALPTTQVALIGVYGSDAKRRALVRLPSGRYVKVNVGDRIGGGKVAAIGRNSIKYVKGGRSQTLKVPEG